MDEIKVNIEVVEEFGDFQFVGDVVKFKGQVIDSAIGQGVFLMYQELKEKENQRAEASRLRNYYRKELTRQSNHIKGRKEQVTWILRKIENIDIQNRALIEYAKVLKKKVLETESQAK